MARIHLARLAHTAKYGVLIGIAGGIAEIIWIAFYAVLAGTNSAIVASAVSATVSTALPGIPLDAAPVVYGIVVHMLFAAGLGVALVFAWHALTGQRPRRVNEYAFMAVALAIVWAFNFFVVLPLINPDFVQLVPYSVSLASKLLFGLAGAIMLRRVTVARLELLPVHVCLR
jgi:hypothetical protein